MLMDLLGQCQGSRKEPAQLSRAELHRGVGRCPCWSGTASTLHASCWGGIGVARGRKHKLSELSLTGGWLLLWKWNMANTQPTAGTHEIQILMLRPT
jgi:hypothetical protein